MTLEPGAEIDGYRIEGVLGRGGMGVVYEARQMSLDRVVALKLLSTELSDDPGFRERFRREGLIQARIDHPHIVPVYEAGEFEGSLFLTMRLVRGGTLKDLVLARELEGARTLRILGPVAEALDAAHEVGLIHRDIKPQNILVGARDHAFLADFGLTKDAGEASGLTKTGQFVGTLDYISPEQIRGEPATNRSDVYALGAVLYECLTGVVPFPRQSDAAVLFAHMSDPPPLVTDQRPELPPALDEVLTRAMAKDPAQRYESASDMIDEAVHALGKRVRAVITPPGPADQPEELGIRRPEGEVGTLETRVRQARERDDTPPPAEGREDDAAPEISSGDPLAGPVAQGASAPAQGSTPEGVADPEARSQETRVGDTPPPETGAPDAAPADPDATRIGDSPPPPTDATRVGAPPPPLARASDPTARVPGGTPAPPTTPPAPPPRAPLAPSSPGGAGGPPGAGAAFGSSGGGGGGRKLPLPLIGAALAALVVAGVVIALVASGGGGGGGGMTTTTQAQPDPAARTAIADVVRNFTQNVNSGNETAACPLTTADFRTDGGEQCNPYVNGPKIFQQFNEAGFTQNGNDAEYTIQETNGERTLFRLRNEGGTWRIREVDLLQEATS